MSGRLKVTGPKLNGWPDNPFEHTWSLGLILWRLAFGFEFGGSWRDDGDSLPNNPFVWIYLGLWWVEIYFDRRGEC